MLSGVGTKIRNTAVGYQQLSKNLQKIKITQNISFLPSPAAEAVYGGRPLY